MAVKLVDQFSQIQFQEAEDHAVARRLGGLAPLTNQDNDQTNEVVRGSETQKVKTVTDRLKESKQLLLRREACSACYEKKQTIQLDCSHWFCHECLGQLFLTALSDESLLPVRCCGIPINPNLCYVLLSPSNAKRFSEKQLEHSTTNKMYCPNPRCSFLILLDFADPTKTEFPCPSRTCQTTVCVRCRSLSHRGQTCEERAALSEEKKDQDMAAILKLASEKQWQRCRQCGQMVDLTHGCHHMTCRCGHNFCYRCGVQWKQCNCQHWTEILLFSEANRQVADLEAAEGRQFRPREREEAVREAARGLRLNETCEHDWQKIDCTNRTCGNCPFPLHHYGFRCQGACNQLVCRTCRFFRIPNGIV